MKKKTKTLAKSKVVEKETPSENTRKVTAEIISKKAMLVKLTRKQFNIRKKDTKAAKEYLQQKDVDDDLGGFWKYILPKESLERINKLMLTAYNTHLEMTLPYEDRGARLLKSENYMEYRKAMNAVEAELEKEFPLFRDSYPAFKEEQKAKLKSLYKESDYPAPEQLENKIRLEITVFPVPIGSSFQVDLADEYLHEMQKEVERETMSRFEEAQKSLYTGLLVPLKHFYEILREEKSFKSSSIANITKFCDSIRKLSFVEDPALFEIAEKIQKLFDRVTAEDIREDKEVAVKVKKILGKRMREVESQLSAYF